MKKIIVADRIWKGVGFEVCPSSEDIQVFNASSNEDVLDHHRENKANLIITELNGNGMSAIQLCSIIRETPELKDVSVIACRRENDSELSQCKKCRANLVLTLPLRPGVLRCAVQQLLMIPARVLSHIPFYARCSKLCSRGSFLCESENLSISGMLIKSKADLNPGSRISFTLKLPYAGSYETQADVVRTVKTPGNQRRYGIRFSRLEPSARYAIKMLIEQQIAIEAVRCKVQGLG